MALRFERRQILRLRHRVLVGGLCAYIAGFWWADYAPAAVDFWEAGDTAVTALMEERPAGARDYPRTNRGSNVM